MTADIRWTEFSRVVEYELKSGDYVLSVTETDVDHGDNYCYSVHCLNRHIDYGYCSTVEQGKKAAIDIMNKHRSEREKE